MKGSKKQPAGSENSLPGIDLDHIERLLAFMSAHGLEEFEYTQGDLRIRLKKAATQQSAAPVLAIPVAQSAPPQPVVAPSPVSAPPAPAPPVAEPVHAVSAVSADEHVIKSPIVGTFYAGASPEAGPFVRVGDFVEAGQTVCIVEAMKLMNEIEADVSGEIVRVLVENAQPVEYGEPLFAMRATGKKK